jgi:putative acetyltransferase
MIRSVHARRLMKIAKATDADLDAVLRIEREAFGQDDEAQLVAALLRDPTAQPVLSLLGYDGERPIGHVLFTKVTLDSRPDVSCSILAPLVVVPAFQRRGVGRALIEHGARRLAESKVKLLFVLGDPGYYTRCGFGPAMPYGLRAPYPIVPEEAWMVRSLAPGMLGTVEGTVACASTLAPRKYWVE